MPRKSYTADWDNLYAQWILAETMSLTEFFSDKDISRTSGNTVRHTDDWIQKKREFRKSLADQVIKEAGEEYIADMKSALSILVSKRIVKPLKDLAKGEGTLESDFLKTMTAKELKIYWEILRVENGLPTSVTKNDNANQNVKLTHAEFVKKMEQRNKESLIKSKDE